MSREPAKRHVEMGCFRRRIRTLDEEQRPLRVNLLITDDVGAGKTVEADLVLREILLRRGVDFTVVSAPVGIVREWQDELKGS
jgi:hypothetical protein